MKSITSRIQEITDIGKVEEDGTTFSNVAKALNSIGIAAVDAQGQLRPLQEILDELGPMWATLDRNHQAYIATVLAGNRQQSRFIALMDNYDRALELVNVSQTANGEGAKQLRDYQTGLEASFTSLVNAWQQLATKLADSSTITALIDGFTGLVEIINDIPKPVLKAVSSFLVFTKAISSIMKISKAEGVGSLFVKTFGIDDVASGLSNKIKEIVSSIDALNTTMNKMSNKNFDGVRQQLDGVDRSVKTVGASALATTGSLETSAAQSNVMGVASVGAAGAQQKLAESIDQVTGEFIANNPVMEEEQKDIDEMSKSVQNLAIQYKNVGKAAEDATGKTGLGSEIFRQRELSKNFEDQQKQLDKDFTGLKEAIANEWKRDAFEEFNSVGNKAGEKAVNTYEEAMKRVEDEISKNPKSKVTLFDFDTTEDKRYLKEYESYAKIYKERSEQIATSMNSIRSAMINNINLLGTDYKATDINFLSDDLYDYLTEPSNVGSYKEDKNFIKNTKNEQALAKQAQNLKNNYSDILQKVVGEGSGKFISIPAKFSLDKEGFRTLEDDLLKEMDKISAIPLPEPKKTVTQKALSLFNNMKTGAEKVKVSLDGLKTKFKDVHIASQAFSSFVIGTMASLAANYIPGVNDQLSQTIGLLAGLGSFGYNIGGQIASAFGKNSSIGSAIGTSISIAIGFAISAYNDLENKAKETEKVLGESMDEWDKSSEELENLQSIADTYDELHGKINKTAEEQERLNSALQEMVEEAPNAVMGYDIEGNPIVDQARLEEEIQKKREENAEKANKTVIDAMKDANAQSAKLAETTGDKVMKGALAASGALSGAGALGTAGSTFGPIGTFIGSVIGAIGGGIAGYWSGSELEAQFNRNEKAREMVKQLQKQGGTVSKAIMEQAADAIATGSEEGLSDRQNLASYLASGSYEEFSRQLVARQREEDLSDKDIEKLTEEYQNDMNNAFIQLGSVGGLDKVTDLVSMVQNKLDSGATWNEVQSSLNNQLNSIFAQAGIDTETAAKLTTGIENKIFENLQGNIPRMQAQVQQIIDEVLSYDEDADTGNLEKIKNKLGNLNQSSASAVANSGLLSDIDGNDSEGANALLKVLNESEELNKASYNLDGTLNKNGATIQLLTMLYGKLGKQIGDLKDDAIQNLMNTLETTTAPKFSEIATNVETAISGFNDLVSVMDSLEDNEGVVDLDTFTTLFNTLDSIDEAVLTDFNNVEMYTKAFQSLADGVSVVNGQLKLEAGAVQSLADLKRMAYMAEIKQMISQVDVAIEQNKFERQLMEAQKKALLAALNYEGDVNGARLVMEQTLRSELSGLENQWLDNEAKTYSNFVGLVNSALKTAGNSFNKFYTALKNGDFSGFSEEEMSTNMSDFYNDIVEKFIKNTTDPYKNISADEFNDVIQAQLDGLEQSLKLNSEELASLEARKQMLSGLLTVAEAGNGALADFSRGVRDAEDDQEDYNEQLERTLTLMEKIAGLAHKISENENFMDLYDNYNGTEYAKLMMENLDLAKQQYDVYKDLFEMQQEMTDQAAGDLLDSPYGHMFQIQENGDIGWSSDAMYDKYKGLPDEMQEDIDNLVQAFQEQRDALRDTELELVNYANALKEAQQAVVDLTIDAENTIVDALKNRESIMHEARKKALEDEIDMIEKAVEARQKAQEQQEDASGVYDAQEALRRATLDSSGKNNAQLLQLQQDLEDKQKEIAEKRFEDDMDDRKQWLQDTIDAEQETYDYRLEMMTWYWEQVQVIMEQSTEYIMQFLIQWDEEYRQVSATQQEQLRQQWEFTFTQLKTITEMLDEPIINLKNNLSNVTAEVQNMNVNVQALPGSWNAATAAANNYYEAAKRAASVGGYSGGGFSGGGSGGDSGGKKTGGGAKIPSYQGNIKKGMTLELDREEYHYMLYSSLKGGKITYIKDSGLHDKNVEVLSNPTWSSSLNGYYIKVKVDGKTGYMRASMDQQGLGINKYFHDRGWLQSGTKYASGGLVDYTGPAWVDGTSSKPEAFLNPYQTEQIGALADALDTNIVKNFANNSNITFGSINFNVASMSSAADGKKALEVFVKGANDLMAKKGVGTKLNLNVK